MKKELIINSLNKIFQNYYKRAKEIALNNEEGQVYTDHNTEHFMMVLDKTTSIIKSIKEYVTSKPSASTNDTDYIPFSDKVNSNVITAISLAHDTGMCGFGYTFCIDSNGLYIKQKDNYYKMKPLNITDYSEIRTNHGLNSALIVLQNRKELRNLGFTDVEIDEIATICMSHFISTSGVFNVNSKKNWFECFLRINSAIKAYNNDNTNSLIYFDEKPLISDNYLRTLATESLAIRLGDVSRDSGPKAKSQSGEIVFVDRNSFNNKGNSIESELKNAHITIGDSGKEILSLKSRQVHAGEQNILFNETHIGSNNSLVHTITVKDGNSVPKCTQTAIHDHTRVLASAPKESFDVEIKFLKNCDAFSKSSYNSFRNDCIKEYTNINIIYPW